MCIQRQLITAVKGATRHKHGPLNSYVSFSRPVGDDDEGERVARRRAPGRAAWPTPPSRWSAASASGPCRPTSTASSPTSRSRCCGCTSTASSYAEIADELHRQTKSIDNALQRIKRKLSVHLTRRAAAEAG